MPVDEFDDGPLIASTHFYLGSHRISASSSERLDDRRTAFRLAFKCSACRTILYGLLPCLPQTIRMWLIEHWPQWWCLPGIVIIEQKKNNRNILFENELLAYERLWTCKDIWYYVYMA
ncbi:hypothetical protein P152DRAFT_231755 [Eremomyces bilateralis CBS 781.70]|uniref:Uncharacterized protein n=1 Tax=Eremomyces bilateralis CBS 781.70 TaxID=1392243 RepID=A0A6G1G9J9_9PEZI|nr:uncharacterized protein P152DRAFT_231755 [Eremomyces bilateralis CBS 781.70]KAF1814758.1 hypothetical protein P152DRAFT_231755 [Eremomyces bilateralis CBS 781.70]